MDAARTSVRGAERRAYPRYDVEVAASIGRVVGRTENLSDRGVCVVHDAQYEFLEGDRVAIELEIPRGGRARVEAEVRWSSSGRTGLRFVGRRVGAIAAFVASLALASSAPAAESVVPEFDPNAQTDLDMDAGGERPDEFFLLQAFEQQYDDFDRCVARAKGRAKRRLPGDVDVSVLLNPEGHRPLGVNAQLPDSVRKNRKLRECLRAAVAAAPFPAYDGVPVVAQFSFELDPGTVWVEGDD